MDRLTYPNMKADLGLCKQQLKELCGEERKTAFRRIPPQRIDFDLQFAAAFKELQAYRDTGLMPDEIQKLKAEVERLTAENATNEKALELICSDLLSAYASPINPENIDLYTKKYIQQAQQTHETQEAEK